MNRQLQYFNTPSRCCTLLLGPGLLVIGAMTGSSPLVAADAPSWPCYQGPNGNFSASDCNLTLVDDLAQAKLLWKSEEPTPVGAGQSKRYGGHGWHTISLGNYKAVTIPLAGGGTVTSGGGVPLPSGGCASPVMADGRLFVSYFVPTGEVVDAGEQTKRDKGPGTWTPDYWKVDAHDVILAIDPATGKTLWKQVFANKGINWQDHKSCMTGHAPCTYNGRVYAIGSTCRVYCVEAATGKPVWEADLGAEHQRIEEHKKKSLETKAATFGVNRGHCNSSAFAAGVLVCPDYQGGLIGFDGVSGKKLWSLTACIGKYGTPTRSRTGRCRVLSTGN